MRWVDVEERLPDINEDDIFDMAWRLCDFGGNYFCVARFISIGYERWQLADYSWAKRPAIRWAEMPKNTTIREFLNQEND